MSGTFPMVFSVTSGKGGVGKTNISVNVAVCLAKLGKRVVLLDADLGLANVDVLLGLTPTRNIFHLLNGEAPLSEVLFPTPYGFSILPASSGMAELCSLSSGQKFELLDAFDCMEDDIDCLIVDNAAGINENVLYFDQAVQRRLVVLSPEPTSLTDGYALIKTLKHKHAVEQFDVCVNMSSDQKEAKEVFTSLYKACDHFLSGVSLNLAGVLPRDAAVRKAIMRQVPFVVEFEHSPVARAVAKLARDISEWEIPTNQDGNIKIFWKKFLGLE
ncbi:MAG: MinD/ParA family protein [Desulfovibrio sp.]|jgi:flagellar biosynthesis protein FlhG|nr:MinD/ParA family protein [Desulfovibrio sp.]